MTNRARSLNRSQTASTPMCEEIRLDSPKYRAVSANNRRSSCGGNQKNPNSRTLIHVRPAQPLPSCSKGEPTVPAIEQTPRYRAHQVLEFLDIGDSIDGANYNYLCTFNVHHILNLTSLSVNIEKWKSNCKCLNKHCFEEYKFPVTPQTNFREFLSIFEKTNNIIEQMRKSKGRLLVVSDNLSLGVAIGAQYIMAYWQMNFIGAKATVDRNLKMEVPMTDQMKRILNEWERILKIRKHGHDPHLIKRFSAMSLPEAPQASSTSTHAESKSESDVPAPVIRSISAEQGGRKQAWI